MKKWIKVRKRPLRIRRLKKLEFGNPKTMWNLVGRAVRYEKRCRGVPYDVPVGTIGVIVDISYLSGPIKPKPFWVLHLTFFTLEKNTTDWSIGRTVKIDTRGKPSVTWPPIRSGGVHNTRKLHDYFTLL